MIGRESRLEGTFEIDRSGGAALPPRGRDRYVLLKDLIAVLRSLCTSGGPPIIHTMLDGR